MKVIIAGGRTFDNYELIEQTMAELDFDVDYVISGGAYGADSLGERWAENHNIPVQRYPAQWNKYGRRAGVIRNRHMALVGDYLVAFWDGESKGTKIMIDMMKERGKHGKVVMCENNL